MVNSNLTIVFIPSQILMHDAISSLNSPAEPLDSRKSIPPLADEPQDA